MPVGVSHKNKGKREDQGDGILAECRVLGSGRMGGERDPYRVMYLLILSCLILPSSVVRGIPSLAAAPSGPATFPLLSASAFSMISFSKFSRVLARAPDSGRPTAWLESHAPSTENVSPLQMITARSTIFCNPRMLPGH